jgi:hypothetical protein
MEDVMTEPEAFSEREKSIVSALVEEYKSKILQIIALDAEINKWSASYIVALVVGIGWALGNEKIQNLNSLFIKDNDGLKFGNCYLILFIALINSLYILWLTIKGYQAQQIHYYINTVTGKQISELIRAPYNSFEIWRRSEIFCSKNRVGKSDWRRTFYYAILTLMPIVVSFSVLYMYGQFVFFSKKIVVNDNEKLFFFILNCSHGLIILLHIGIGCVAASTAMFNKLWRQLTLKELNDPSELSVARYISSNDYLKSDTISISETPKEISEMDKENTDASSSDNKKETNSTRRRRGKA